MLACTAFLLFPVYLEHVTPGLDSSWKYGLNRFHDMGILFGKDVVFTYGPLGFLCHVCNIGSNILESIFFWVCILLVNLYLFSCIAFEKKPIKNYSVNLCISLIFVIIGFPVAGDYYILYLVLLALSLDWYSSGRSWHLPIAILLSSLLFFIKFSAALSAFSALFTYMIISALAEKKDFIHCAWLFLLLPVLCIGGYLLYNPSIDNLFLYLRSAWEISSGYSSAMSLAQNNGPMIMALLSICMYAAFSLWILMKKKNAGLYMLLFIGPMFCAYKHGFVRADGHIFVFFRAFLLFLSIIAIFKPGIDMKLIQYRQYACGFWPVILLLSIVPICHLKPFPSRISKKITARTYNCVHGAVDKVDNPFLSDNQLPPRIVHEVHEAPTTIFPLDISYAAYNDIEYKPMPVFQAYSAYTPFLDGLNASFFRKNSTAPEYVILSLETIDDRIPLMEVPRTYLSLVKNYRLSLRLDNIMLLKRRSNAQRMTADLITRKCYDIQDRINIRNGRGELALSIDMKLTQTAKLRKAGFRIPPVHMIIGDRDGRHLEGRIIPENLDTIVMVHTISESVREMASIFDGNSAGRELEYIRFAGPGLRYYQKEVEVALYDCTLTP